MSTPSTEQQTPPVGGEWDRRKLEIRLFELQQEDYVMPGWQTYYNDEEKVLMVTFQPCHQGTPEVMADLEFRAWLRGWDARRAAVMARRPRTENGRRKP